MTASASLAENTLTGAWARGVPREQSSGVTLSLMAGFELAVGGRPIIMPLGVQRVVAFVALQGRAVPRSYVVGNLWPESAEDQARASLRSALWRLRRLEGALLSGDAAHLMVADSVMLDVNELPEAARDLESGRADLRDRHLHRLFSSELLPGWYDDWVIMARERLRFAQLRALEATAQRSRTEGRLTDAEAAYRAAAALEPFKETVQRGLIEVLLAAGSPGEAIRRYRDYRHLLREELDAEPSAQMEALLQEVRPPVTAG